MSNPTATTQSGLPIFSNEQNDEVTVSGLPIFKKKESTTSNTSSPASENQLPTSKNNGAIDNGQGNAPLTQPSELSAALSTTSPKIETEGITPTAVLQHLQNYTQGLDHIKSNLPVYSATIPKKDGYSWERKADVIGHVGDKNVNGSVTNPVADWAQNAISKIDNLPDVGNLHPEIGLGKELVKSTLGSIAGLAQGSEQISKGSGELEKGTVGSVASGLTQIAAGMVKSGFSGLTLVNPQLAAFNVGMQGTSEVLPSDWVPYAMSPLSTLLQKTHGVVVYDNNYYDIGNSDGVKAAAELGDLAYQILAFHGAKELGAKVLSNTPLTPEEQTRVNDITRKGIDEIGDATKVTKEQLLQQPADLPDKTKIQLAAIPPKISEQIPEHLAPETKVEVADKLQQKETEEVLKEKYPLSAPIHEHNIEALNLQARKLAGITEDETPPKPKKEGAEPEPKIPEGWHEVKKDEYVPPTAQFKENFKGTGKTITDAPEVKAEEIKKQDGGILKESDIDNEGDLTDTAFEKVQGKLNEIVSDVAQKNGIPESALKKAYNLSDKGEYISSQTPIRDIAKSIKYHELIKGFKDVASELFPDNIDEVFKKINSHSKELLDALERGDETFKVDKNLGKIYDAFQEINSRFNEAIEIKAPEVKPQEPIVQGNGVPQKEAPAEELPTAGEESVTGRLSTMGDETNVVNNPESPIRQQPTEPNIESNPSDKNITGGGEKTGGDTGVGAEEEKAILEESQGGGNKVGVSHGSLGRLADKLGLPQPLRGQRLSPKEFADRGRRLLDAGADPKQVEADFKKGIQPSADDISVARVHLEDLYREQNRAGDAFETKRTPENKKVFDDATNAVQQWAEEVVKPMGTKASEPFTALQGERDIDTGSFTAIKNARSEVTGKAQTDLPEPIKQLSEKVKHLEEKTNELQKQLTDALNKGEAKKEKPSAAFKKAADNFRKLKTKPFVFKDENGNEYPIEVKGFDWNGLVELGAKAIERTGDIADGVAEIIDKIKDAEWYKNFTDTQKADLQKQLTSHYEGEIANTPEAKSIRRLEKQLEDLQQGKVKDKPLSRKISDKEKELKEQIIEAKKNLGLIESKMPKPEDVKTQEEKNLERLQEELKRLQDENKLKKSPEKRETSDEEKSLQHQIEIEQDRIKYNNMVEQFADKKDNDLKFTPEQSANIWEYAKKNYIDNNPSFKVVDMVNKVAMDLGLTPEQVRHALGTTAETRKLSDQLYRNQYEKNKAHRTIQRWVNKTDDTPVTKLLDALASPFRSLATLGHGHALLFTHAGSNLFDPQVSGKFLTAVVRQFKLVYGDKANYEKAQTDLQNHPLYNKALQAGAAIDPTTVYDDWQLASSFLQKLHVQGNKGFLVLKMMRMELFANEYNHLSDIEKADPNVMKVLAENVNHWTGTAGLKVLPIANAFVFAPNLIASKFSRLTIDPARALYSVGRQVAGKEVSAADMAASKIILKKTGRVLATYAAALAANQAMLYLSGSNQNVNFTHPTRSDWLRFKTGDTFGGRNVDVTGGMTSTMQFMTQLWLLPFESQKDTKEDYHGARSAKDATQQEIMGYLHNTLSPFGGTVYDFLSHTDYAGNVLPMYNDKPQGSREKLSYLQYIGEKLPIPVADALKTIHDQMVEEGVSKVRADQIVGGFLAGGIASMGIKVGSKSKAPQNPFTDQDLKDPVFKYFIDKGFTLPNVSLRSVQITDTKNGTQLYVSDYPKEKQQEYTAEHNSQLKTALSEIEDKGNVYVSYYKDAKGNKVSDVSLNYNPKATVVPLDKLTKEETAQVLSIAQKNATTKAKDIVFFNNTSDNADFNNSSDFK